MKAVICPVCNGAGEIDKIKFSGIGASSASQQIVTCHGCGGRGWVEVSEDAISESISSHDPNEYHFTGEH